MKLGQYSSSASLIGLCLCITSKKLYGYYLGVQTFSSRLHLCLPGFVCITLKSVDNFCNASHFGYLILPHSLVGRLPCVYYMVSVLLLKIS